MVLHARNPQKNVARAYILHVGRNLFGEVEGLLPSMDASAPEGDLKPILVLLKNKP